MLRLVDPNKHYPVTICDIEFKMRSMSVREKFITIEQLGKLAPSQTSYDAMIDVLCSVISSIDGSGKVKEVLNSIEAFDDVLKIVQGVITYCSMTDDTSKNSGSSSDTSILKPTGN